MVSVEKKSPLNIKNNRFKNEIVDLTMCISRLQLSAITKACSLKSVVKDVTIGPNSSQEIFSNDSSGSINDCSTLITSTPQKEKFCHTNKIDISNIEKDNDTYAQLRLCEEHYIMERLEEMEVQRKSKVQNKMLERLAKMKAEQKRIVQDLERKKESMYQERLVQASEEFAEVQKLLKEEELRAKLSLEKLSQSNLNNGKRLKDTNERIRELQQQQQEQKEKERERKRESRMCLDEIFKKQLQYRKLYEQIHEVCMNCKDSKELLELLAPEALTLKALNENFDMILEKCQKGTVCPTDLKTVQYLVEEVNNIYIYFLQSADKLNKNIQKKEDDAKTEAEKRAKQEKKKSVTKEALILPNLSALTDCVDEESLAESVKLSKFLEKYEQSLEPLINDDKTKQFRFNCQKAVNVPVNAISHFSTEHLEDKFVRLSRLLHGQSVMVGDSHVNASSHPLGVAFCSNLLATKFIQQGEQTVSSKPEAAFAIAAVIVALWIDFPEFGKLLMAHFQRICPYIIPAYMPQVEGQSNEDYYRTLGYQYIDGKVESQDKFLKRMSGVVRLYFAITITNLKRSQANKQHPLGINEAWRCLSAILNLEPRPDISATLVYDLVEVTGSLFYQTYVSQFRKLLLLLCKDYLPHIEKISPGGCVGPVSRLEAFLQRILTEGKIPPPDGVLPVNFW